MELTVFIIAFVASVGISCLCSLMESAFYAVSLPFVKAKAEEGSKNGKILLKLKEDTGKAISAILILNTIANTAGAAVTGWAIGHIWGADALLPFSILYTLVILYFSEIIPKLIGVTYSRFISMVMARPLNILVKVLAPLISISNYLSKKLRKDGKGEEVSTAEVLSMAEIGAEDGAIDNLEEEVIENIIGLDSLTVADVLTPRVVVERFNQDLTLDDIKPKLDDLAYSRIPIYSESDPDELLGYVTQRDILRELLHGNDGKKLSEIARSLKTVPELMHCDKLLMEMLNTKEHMYAVVDEHGGLAGIITMEDIVEEIVGHEIVDEYDAVTNMRALARLKRYKRSRAK